VLTASSGPEGIRLATTIKPTLITLDLMMPGMDGWETLRHLQKNEELRDIPVVIVTAAPDDERGIMIGAIECVDKAASHDTLISALRCRLRGSS
jgi:CheY-like chemotaxis protein